MNASPVQVQTFFGTNPVAGKLIPRPRKDAHEADFWRKDSKTGKPRAASPEFLRIAQGLLLSQGYRADAALTVAFARSMEHRIAKLYAVEFARYRAREFFPMSTEIDPGAMSFSYKMIERMGNAQLIHAGNARDIPRVTIGGQETQMPVVTYGAGYGFTVIEEKSAALAQIAIETELAKATREAIEAFAESMYAIGLPGTDIVGVTNAPGVQIIPQKSKAAGTWATQIAAIAAASLTNATPPAVVVAQNLVMDLTFGVQTIAINTLERQAATNALLPTNLYNMLKGTPRSPGYTDDTLLDYVQKVTGLQLDSWNILMNIGTLPGSTLTLAGTGPAQNTRIVVYDKDPDVVQLMEAQPFIQLAPQLAGFEYAVPCYERSGGAMAIRPLGIVCIDGC